MVCWASAQKPRPRILAVPIFKTWMDSDRLDALEKVINTVDYEKNPTYPWSIPQKGIPKPPNERNSFINRWLGVWGMFQGYVGKFLD